MAVIYRIVCTNCTMLRGSVMKSAEYNDRKQYVDTLVAVAEGLWNGLVVSGVLTVSVFLFNKFWIF